MKNMQFLKEIKIAHRGIYDNERIYENTMAAFQRAVKHKYIIELDLRMLSDGSIVCFHDENTKRLLHLDQEIEKLTYDEISYMSKFQIPLFKDVLKEVDGKVPLLIELKSITKKHKLELAVAEMLDNYNGQFAIQSFNMCSVKWFYKNRPEFIIGHLVCKKNMYKDPFFKKFDFYNVNIQLYSEKKIKKMKFSKMVLGYKIMSKKEYLLTKDLYDNLVFDNILEIDSK